MSIIHCKNVHVADYLLFSTASDIFFFFLCLFFFFSSRNLTEHATDVQKMLTLIHGYVTSGDYQEPQPNHLHFAALPQFHGGAWAPWIKDEL